MKNSPNYQSGLSLIEIMVVIGIFVLIMSLGLVTTFSSFKGTIFRSERSTLVSVLDRTRSRAMNNYYESSHGVCYDNSSPNSPNYIIFRGNTFVSGSPTNETLSSSPAVAITSSPNTFLCSSGGIVFSQLTGNSPAVSITLTEDGKTSVVSTNIVGRIDW